MAHEWRSAVAETHRQEDLKYLVGYVSGDTAGLGHGLAEGTAVLILKGYEVEDWVNLFDHYVTGSCCDACDEGASGPRLDPMPTLGVVTVEEWMQHAGRGTLLDVRPISENDLAGLGTRPWTRPVVDYFDVADRVWRLRPDGTPDKSEIGTVTGEFENDDIEVIWDSTPGCADAHPPRSLVWAQPI